LSKATNPGTHRLRNVGMPLDIRRRDPYELLRASRVEKRIDFGVLDSTPETHI
jgi:hypothetical protein